MKLIYIEWEDAFAQSAWLNKAELEKFHNEDNTLVREVGWVYKEDRKYLTLIGRIGPQIIGGEGYHCYGQLQKIPKTWIRKRQEINLK